MDDDRAPHSSRIHTPDGKVLIVSYDPATDLTILAMEDSDGVVVASRVLDADDRRLLAAALEDVRDESQISDSPVELYLSQIIGRD